MWRRQTLIEELYSVHLQWLSKVAKEGFLEKDTSGLSFKGLTGIEGGQLSGVGGGQGKNIKEGILGRESMYKSMLSPNFPVPIYNGYPESYT